MGKGTHTLIATFKTSVKMSPSQHQHSHSTIWCELMHSISQKLLVSIKTQLEMVPFGILQFKY